MRLIVQKYGGTSVGNPERIRKVAERLLETQREGCRVVAVISAMAGVTNSLIKLARETSPQPPERELDLLLATGEQAAVALTAMAVNALVGKPISPHGAEPGVLTAPAHTRTVHPAENPPTPRPIDYATCFAADPPLPPPFRHIASAQSANRLRKSSANQNENAGLKEREECVQIMRKTRGFAADSRRRSLRISCRELVDKCWKCGVNTTLCLEV